MAANCSGVAENQPENSDAAQLYEQRKLKFAGNIVRMEDVGLLTDVLYKHANAQRERLYDKLKLPQEHLSGRVRKLENMYECDASKYIREMMVIFVETYAAKAKLGVLLNAVESLPLDLAAHSVAEEWEKENSDVEGNNAAEDVESSSAVQGMEID